MPAHMKPLNTLAIAAAFLCGISSINAASDTAAQDEAFIRKAAQGGMTEVRLGEIAKTKAKHTGVREFGAMMVTDHGKANTELKTLAEAKGVKLSTELEGKHQATVDRLNKLSDDAFDKAYVEEMVSDHKKDVADFEKFSGTVKDAELKAFVDKTLPTLRTHLDRVLTLQKEMKK